MTSAGPEDLAAFTARVEAWVEANLRPVDPALYEGAFRTDLSEEEELAAVGAERALQRRLYDAGLAGLCVPRAYGGQGLTPEHQQALNRAIEGHEFPVRLQAPTFTPCLAVLLEFGTEEQKRAHVPAILRGEELWMQLLSEPGGGSDVAGALTTAVRDGDQWVLNGSKIWTTGAWWSDWGLCLARTNWDVPKHRGLTVFMLPLRRAGVDIHRIEMLNGSREFCQEFFTDVVVPDTDRVGDVDEGWTVGVRWMFYERLLYETPLVTFPSGLSRTFIRSSYAELARAAGRGHDPAAQELVGEARMLDVAFEVLQERIALGVRTGRISDQAAAVARLFKGVTAGRTRTIAFELAGMTGGVWTADDGPLAERGVEYLMRQAGSIGGGTTEMARNVISERVLGMPRERAGDRDIPFREVPRAPSSPPSGLP
ncbi:MAG TPA: acyl-CoA dehydrogenase family protein [Acidimicrobiales bacterium]|nr:acyl-CoA dehydrogenase family protein [Acidimicrobiales bacterium]